MSRDPLEAQEYETITAAEAHRVGLSVPEDAVGARLYGARLLVDQVQDRVPISEPGEPISKHKVISLWKSGLRISGTLLGCWVFRHSLPSVTVFMLFGLAEVLGIAEENHEND